MSQSGAFGYIINKKKYMMYVEYDADLLWKLLVREIYILMKHYGSKDLLEKAFKEIKIAKYIPNADIIEKCKCYSDLSQTNHTWSSILKYCQSSYINIIESGYILNTKDIYGFIFILNFDKETINYYNINLENKKKILNSVTINEIMEFDEMPKNSYIEIIQEMKERFTNYYDSLINIQKEIISLKKIKEKANKQGAVNIEEKVDILLYNMNWEEKQLNMNRRVFFHRLKALNLIDDDN